MATNDKVIPLRQNERLGSNFDGSKGLIIGGKVRCAEIGSTSKGALTADGTCGSPLHIDFPHFHGGGIQVDHFAQIRLAEARQ